MPAPTAVRRAAFTARSLAGIHPATFRAWSAVQRRRAPGAQAFIDDRTRLVIDGYQGSANSYATVAIRRAQPPDFAIAHHLHAPAAIRLALERDLPHIVLLRAPGDACASNLRRFPHLGPEQVVRGWIRYYRPLLDVRRDLLVATFDEVVGDVNGVIDRVDERHPGTLARLSVDEDELASIRPDPAADASRAGGGVDRSRRRLAGPSVERLLARAQAIHDQLQS